MSHTCHAHGCIVEVPPRMFMCRSHWFSLPKKLQNAIWREYRPGQENDKQPSLQYLAVQQFAVGVAAFKPYDEEAARVCASYITKAIVFRDAAVREGHRDPLLGLVGLAPV